MLFIFLTILLTITTGSNVAITTRGSRYLWRNDRSESPRYNQEWDQYRDYTREDHPYRGHLSFNERRPSQLSIEDIYREAERYNHNNYNSRFHRQNRWSFDNRDHINHNPEKFFASYQQNDETQNTHNTRNFGEINTERDARQTLYTPAPHLPWEDALRHSVYLTLIRDKIDNILATNRKPNAQNIEQNQHDKDLYESTDVDLWRNIKKAPFKTNGKEKGPVFGDIAILSRGKLVEKPEGFEFIEDENFKECIECHLYSARPNEDEAEKILMTNCNEPNCKNQIIRALWTVRRIRHRNPEGEEPKFMYELMFSIASPKANSKGLDYNTPSQTFTINEGDKNIKNNLDEKRNKVIFTDEKNHQTYKSGLNYFSNTNANRQVNKNDNNGEYNDLNLGEYAANKQSIKSNPRIMNLHEENSEQSNNLLRNKHNNHLPVITHLHHHYYLNDKGIPMLKPSIKYDKHNNFETIIPNIHNVDSITEMDPRTLSPNFDEIVSTTASDYDKATETSGIYASTNNPNSRSTFPKQSKLPLPKFKKVHHPAKQFIPSQKDERITYSEPDPLYTVSTKPKAPTTIKSTLTPVTEVSKTDDYFDDDDGYGNRDDKVFTEKNTQKPFLNYEDSLTNPDSGTTIQNIYISESPIQNDFHEKELVSEEPQLVHIVYPETTKKQNINPSTESPKQTTASKRIERRPYKVTRRVKQKKFSELLKAQPSKPSTTAPSSDSAKESSKDEESENKKTEELQQKISDVSRKFASNKTDTFEPQRSTRFKYQRKFNYSWNSKRTRSTTTTTEKSTTLDEDETLTENNTEELSTETVLDTTHDHDSIQDNIEGESEKEIRVDKISTISDYIINESLEESLNTHDNNTEINKTTTEPNITEATKLYEEEFEVTDSNNEANSTSNVQNSTETTIFSSGTEDEGSMYTPLTKKSYVTSISLKLGNKTRPYYPSITENPVDDTNIVEETRLTENMANLPKNSSKNETPMTTMEEEIEITTKEASKVTNTTEPNTAETEEGEIVAKIVEHASLHKLKIEDI